MQKKEYDRHENQSDLTYHMITDWLNSAADNRATEKNIKMSVDAISSEITNQTFRKALAILLRQPVSTDSECCRNRFSDDKKKQQTHLMGLLFHLQLMDISNIFNYYFTSLNYQI